MTIATGWRAGVPGCDGFGMKAAIVHRLLVGMALRALHLGRRCLMHRALDVAMAIYAGEHSAVDRGSELFGRNVQADWRAIDLFGEGRIAMASQAVAVGRFLCSS